MDFTVLITVYKNDKAEDFRTALKSITVLQTVRPSEVVLVIDGPVSDKTYQVIADAESSIPGLYKVIRFEKNQGLGVALQKGLEACTNEIVMRMDSDDIAVPDRFEKQLQFMEEHPTVAVCGGQITEFIDAEGNIVGRRSVPCSNEEIYKYMKSRCAFNHMTVSLRRTKVLEVGNYLPWFWNEDYFLWIRLMIAKAEFAKLPDTLVNVRVGKDMYARRGGMKYFKSELKIQKYMYSHNIIRGGHFLTNVTKRLIVQVLLPNKIRGWVFRTFAREK